MAKNELLPFADGEDANVLPTAQWEVLTDILENGFQSGIAKSEQVNRVLAQGAVASYVLGQLIVDQLNKDATLDKNVLYQNLILALQENAKDACLPLSGGTMAGGITLRNGDNSIVAPSNDTYIEFEGGTAYGNGASLALYGKNSANTPGSFKLFANNGTTRNSFIGDADGNLTWCGEDVVCVESWRNGVNYYRKYSDGWVEQGGQSERDAGLRTINLFIEMDSTNYCTQLTAIGYASDIRCACLIEKTATSIEGYVADGDEKYSNSRLIWKVIGRYA